MKNRISFTMTCIAGFLIGLAVHESLWASELAVSGIGVYLLRSPVLRWFS